ncbi:MAG: DEAD/DEAH box helicase [Treponema sp.]|jgi:superfamily II DNA/RNA helicase|nr:DEAD/DEAH box helicase [Treponema sp.]
MTGSFSALGVLPFFSARLGDRNIYKPTDIQARVIPELLEGRSVIFRSATGTGKTFAYLIPLLQALLPDSGAETPGVRSPDGSAGPALLILSPTYELCSQIKAEAEFLLKAEGGKEGPPSPLSRLRMTLLTGSGNLSRQIDALKKDRPAAAVGNPGRILLLAKMGKIKLGALRSLVFDEGDRLTAEDLRGETLELMDFIRRVRKGGAAGERGLLCAACSATLSAKNREPLLPLMDTDLRIIETDEQEILRERIQHWAIWSEGRRKIQTLCSFLTAARPKKALVFTGSSWDAGNIVSQLRRFSAAGLYGGMDKTLRRDAVAGFRSGKTAILVSSDLASRGLDIPGISHVIALDVPQDGEIYTHRAGRTGRAGKRGIMVSIGDEQEMRRLARLEKRLGLTVYPKELYRGRVIAPAAEEEEL